MITKEQLREALLQEIQREKRLLLRNFMVYGVLGFFFLMVILFLGGFDRLMTNIGNLIGQTKELTTYMIVVLVVVMFAGCYTLLLKLNIFGGKQKAVDELMRMLDDHPVATHINTYKEYKMSIPLFIVKLQLGAVMYMRFTLPPAKHFDLPVPEDLVPEMKTLLSGVNAAEVNKALEDVYSEKVVDGKDEDESGELKSMDEFKAFVARELTEDLAAEDQQKQKSKKQMLIMMGIAGVFMLCVFGYLISVTGMGSGMYVMIGLLGVGAYYVYTMFKNGGMARSTINANYGTTFKTNIFTKVIGFINPNFRYVMHGHLSEAEFFDLGIYEQRSYLYDGNDQIVGKHSGVSFQLCDLHVSRQKNFSKENEPPVTIFKGPAFVAQFNKAFQGETYIISRKVDSQYIGFELGESIRLEDAEFGQLFKVYSNDQIEARTILTPELMERIKSLGKKDKNKLMISFRHNRIGILNYNGKNNFEIDVLGNKSVSESLPLFYEDLCNQLRIIDELKLNRSLWK